MRIKKLQAAHAFFHRNVEEFVVSVGATKTGDGFILNTAIGQLKIWIYDSWIASRFDDPFAATVYTRGMSNRYSGKWNFVYHDDPVTLNSGLVIANFVNGVEKLLTYRPTGEEIEKANQLRNDKRNDVTTTWRER